MNSKLAWTLAGALAAAATYPFLEARAYTLREVTVPVLKPGSAPIKVLHLSDVHMMPKQAKKQLWLRELARLKPDLVVNTGDNISHMASLPSILFAYEPLFEIPGVFVFGSNDYYSPQMKNPMKYLVGGTGTQAGGRWDRERDLPFEQMRREFQRRGWLDLNNAHGELAVAGRRLAFTGVDDPHLEFDRLDALPADPTADLAVGVAHAPYLRVLDRWNSSGYPLIFAGHTHGGQVCVPFTGRALVTNCDLDTSRAKGLHRHQVGDADPSWMHVSAGLGSSPFTPVRVACRPEATLVTLTG